MPAPDLRPAPARLREQQLELTRHLRDPRHVAAPSGIEDRRLAIYRDLLFNNIDSLLAGNFPVMRRLLGEARWKAMVRDFYRDHRAQTPLFPEIAREWLRYLESLPQLEPPFLRELAHYEWVELALQIAEARVEDVAHDPHGDLLEGAPVVSPLAWPLAYAWPVHRLGPEFQPDEAPPAPTFLLLRRETDGNVRFSQLSPLAFRLLVRLDEAPRLSGREQLVALAQEAGVAADAAFLAQGGALLEQMRDNGTLLGTRLDAVNA
ncbi:HvfC family RiPP maturation protein [Lysobacter solisilvae (ex Woo and Kim 2020)]|uniref:Putative DNA-binding domain-containing protein n=1 Tax=Agrilutibacter terrestris TaxID=2865112 RepID=A0A7H0FW63_9GAMM|nr:putative DNA-binding domain-containing protein [Lysobacter terrestris]QNP40279.1 putative DNA-binding domain-containing protein [Lysobacter terrestris]